MLNKLKKNNQGFTIIEVMIVLAIAALILLIVLLAVPALQRNARNTTVKNDAGVVAGLINTAESNSDGAPPTAIAGAAGNLTVTDTVTEKGKISGGATVSTVAAAPATVPVGNVQVVIGKDCTPTAGSRNFALYYSVESSSGATLKCQST